MSVYSLDLRWSNAHRRTHGHCRATVFVPEVAGHAGVIMVSPYPGTPSGLLAGSICSIADALEKQQRLPLLEGYVLVEHVPADELFADRFSMVDLRHDGIRHHSPSWRDLDAEHLDRLVPGGDKPAAVLAGLARVGAS